MQRIIDSILYYKDVLVFLILLLFSIYLVVDSNHYHQSKLNSISNNFTSIIFEWSSSIENYFNLKDNNEELIQENLDLSFKCELEKKIIKNSEYNYQVFLAKDLNKNDLNKFEIKSQQPEILDINGLSSFLSETLNFLRCLTFLVKTKKCGTSVRAVCR